MRGDVKKFKVFVKDPKTGNVKKVNFGHGGTSAKAKGEKTMRIRKSNPKARRNFRKRHNCANPGPKTKARYWSCRKWQIFSIPSTGGHMGYGNFNRIISTIWSIGTMDSVTIVC